MNGLVELVCQHLTSAPGYAHSTY